MADESRPIAARCAQGGVQGAARVGGQRGRSPPGVESLERARAAHGREHVEERAALLEGDLPLELDHLGQIGTLLEGPGHLGALHGVERPHHQTGRRGDGLLHALDEPAQILLDLVERGASPLEALHLVASQHDEDQAGSAGAELIGDHLLVRVEEEAGVRRRDA